jgi:large subunit ribosomal protein L10
MAKTRQKKHDEVREFTEGLKGAAAVVFADLSALKVADSTDLRRRSRKEDVKIKTAKKTLLKRALKDSGIAAVDEKALAGSVSMILGSGDPVAPAKLIETFRKDHENVSVLGGLFEAKWMSASQVKALSSLPSKQELIARVVGSIRAPLSGLVNVLQGNLRGLVTVLNAIKDSKSS